MFKTYQLHIPFTAGSLSCILMSSSAQLTYEVIPVNKDPQHQGQEQRSGRNLISTSALLLFTYCLVPVGSGGVQLLSANSVSFWDQRECFNKCKIVKRSAGMGENLPQRQTYFFLFIFRTQLNRNYNLQLAVQFCMKLKSLFF